MGHHGVYLRHQPCASVAAVGLSELRQQKLIFGVLLRHRGAGQPAGAALGVAHLAAHAACAQHQPKLQLAERLSLGIAVGSALGGALAGITPFKPGQAFAMALIACLAGSLGHLVMKALKRDRGVPIWRNEQGGVRQGVTGAGGLLDRVDALCFAAPVFFHFVQWYFQLYK